MNVKKYIAAVGALVILVALFFGTQTLRDKYASHTDNNNSQNTDEPQPVSEGSTKSYTDPINAFAFTYSADLDQYDPNKLSSVPDFMPSSLANSSFYTNKVLAKILPVQYCGLSGQCQSTTTNFIINVEGGQLSEQDLISSEIGPSLIKTQINGHTVYKYEIGAEGEGIIYYYVLSDDGRAVIFELKYLNEQVSAKYKTVDGFVPYADQIKTTEQIIQTLKFNSPPIVNAISH